MHRLTLTAVAGLLALCALCAVQAGAATQTATLRTVTTKPMVVTGSRFTAGEHVKILLAGRSVARATADRSGKFRVTLARPASTKCGQALQLRATGAGGHVANLVVKFPATACQATPAKAPAPVPGYPASPY
ncbi:MAG TPA: hypothetical protein VKD47_04465 [Miltoncostaeaceae bacterium]|nr:hypothetical protein [Miltoncostaeaceae bacterium]